MRLINARTLQLEDVWSETDREYAILSHRWEDEEVSFQDFLSSSIGRGTERKKKGFEKIRRSCEQAVRDGLEYVWVDTCCIDKSSSAELTEAINSMFRWYKAASVCYAFLSDVQIESSRHDGNGNVNQEPPSSFSKSVWFTRGWTLQELVAPDNVVFYDNKWSLLGTKESLSSVISQITGIDEDILGGGDIFQCSIAQRMSWASGRTTTRVEDTAYCLLGLFDVNMPMLYGEGEKAFLRLQEEIIKTSDDHSIFAWPRQTDNLPGLLASNPAAFANCRRIRTVGSRKGRSSYNMTNRGLSIKLDATPWSVDTYLAALYCVDERLHNSEQAIENFRMGMFVRRLDEDDQYIRVTHGGETFIQVEGSIWEDQSHRTNKARRPTHRIELNIRQKHTPESIEASKERINGFRICTPELLEVGKDGKDKFSISCESWDSETEIMSMRPGRFGTVGHIDISPQGRKLKVVKLGFDFEYNPVCFVAQSGGLSEKVRILDRAGSLDFGLESQEAQWSAEEKAQFPGIYQRSCFDELAWSVITGDTARELKQHSGLWALKGDRVHGLNLRLSDGERVIIERGEYQDRFVWNVQVGDLRNNMIRSMRQPIQSKKSEQVAPKPEDDRRRKSAFKLFR